MKFSDHERLPLVRFSRAGLRASAASLVAWTAALASHPAYAESAADAEADASVLADEAMNADDQMVDRANQIVVTAGRREQSIDNVQATISVVTREAMDTFQGTSVTEALRMVPGVDARTSGANMSVTIRGFIPNAGTSVLLLFDGVPRTGKYGITNLNNFAPEDVERIEVVRGPMSALYGANAAGGVVNVITRAPGEGPAFRGTATFGATGDGDRAGVILSAASEFQTGAVGHRLSVWHRGAEAFSFNSGVADDDLSGINRLSLDYSGAVDLGGHRLRANLQRFRQRDERGGARATRPGGPLVEYTAFENEDLTHVSLQYAGDVGPGLLSFDAGFNRSDGVTNRSFPGPDETTRFDQLVGEGRYALDLGNHALIAGAGVWHDTLDISINTQTAKRTNAFAYLQDEWRATDQITVTLGGRVDDFTLFGTVFNPRASIGWRDARSGLFARAGYGEAFRAPTSLENFSRFLRGRFIIEGNPDLRPEQTRTIETAVGWSGSQARVEVVYHDNKIRDLIEVLPTGQIITGLIQQQYTNRGRAEIRGIEAMGELRPARWLRFDLTYEWLEAVDAATKDRLIGRYEHAVRAQAVADAGPVRMLARMRGLFNLWAPDPAVRGSRPFNSDYIVTDLNVEWAVNRNWRIALGVDNLFDERVPINFSSVGNIEDPPGRYFYATLRAAY